jgi:hypothetical protein
VVKYKSGEEQKMILHSILCGVSILVVCSLFFLAGFILGKLSAPIKEKIVYIVSDDTDVQIVNGTYDPETKMYETYSSPIILQ